MDISKLPIEELISLRDKINSHINNLNDGHVYICEVFSHGDSWVAEGITNKYVLQELCNEYNDEGGYVNVYSTNPTLDGLKNKGKTLFITSVEDYNKWVVWRTLKNKIETVNRLLKRWDSDDKPSYPPPFKKKDIAKYNKELEECDMNFIHPVPYGLEDI
jgi:hypothetical protein